MNYSCPVCHNPPKKSHEFAHTNLYLQNHTTKLQCVEHEIAFLLYVNTSNPDEIVSFYIRSPKLSLSNVLIEGDYYWRIYNANNNTSQPVAHGEEYLSFPQALNLLQRYNNLLVFL